MKKIHLVPTKDALQHDRNLDAAVIVLDVIFATTSIAAALQAGVDHIVPALHFDDALRIRADLGADRCVIAGEYNAQAFPGCLSFDPLTLAQADLRGKVLAYATTNGTVALRLAQDFRMTYAASLLNAAAVARHLRTHADQYGDIVIVCAGSKGYFSLEDFYGAGHVVQCLRRVGPGELSFSDLSQAAEMCFAGATPQQALGESRVGRLMADRGLADSIAYAGKIDASSVVPLFQDGRIRDHGQP